MVIGLLAAPAAAVTLDPNGSWEELGDWPLIAIHAALTSEGDVITYGTRGAFASQSGSFIYDVWDPASGDVEGGHDTLQNETPTDIFCNLQLNDPSSGNLVMFGGDVFLDGQAQNYGNADIVEFDATTRALSSLPGMTLPRWYGSGVTLPDGRIYIQGGLNGEAFPEVWDPINGAQALDMDTTELYWYYPRLFVVPDGRIFGFDTNGRMFTVSQDLTTLTQHGKFASSGVVGDGSSAVQYAPGKILQFGGRSNHTYYIDANGPEPVVTRGPNMSARRSWVDAVLLPDGRVLAIGGSGVKNELDGTKKSAEIWDPATGEWTEYSMGAVARLYHSTALLLPDASVLVAGGGAPGPLVNANAEIYKPGYMVTAGGVEAPRPEYSLDDTEYDVGDTITISSGDAAQVASVRLVKNGAVTHSFNPEQRLIDLPFAAAIGELQATIPLSSSVVTPGSYLLFLIDGAGVPSEAKIINVAPSETTGPVDPPPPDPPGPIDPPEPPPVQRECALRREQGGVTLTWNAAAGTNVRKNGSWAGKFPELSWFDPTGVAADFYVVIANTADGKISTDCIDDGAPVDPPVPPPPPPPPPLDGECFVTPVGGGNSLVFTDPENNDDNWNIRRNDSWLTKVFNNNSYVDIEGQAGDSYEVRYWIPGAGRQDVPCVPEGGPVDPPPEPPPPPPPPPPEPAACRVTTTAEGIELEWDAVPGENRYSVRRNGKWVTTVQDALTWMDPAGSAADSYEVRATVAGVRTELDCA